MSKKVDVGYGQALSQEHDPMISRAIGCFVLPLRPALPTLQRPGFRASRALKNTIHQSNPNQAGSPASFRLLQIPHNLFSSSPWRSVYTDSALTRLISSNNKPMMITIAFHLLPTEVTISYSSGLPVSKTARLPPQSRR